MLRLQENSIPDSTCAAEKQNHRVRQHDRKQGLGLEAQFRKKGVLKHLQDAASSGSNPCSEQFVLLGFSANSGIRGQDGELTALTDDVPLLRPHTSLASDFSTCKKAASQVQLFPMLLVLEYLSVGSDPPFFAGRRFSQRKAF